MGAVKKFVLGFIVLILAACGTSAPNVEPVVEVGYQPPVIPVRVSVNTRGEVDLGFSGEFVTPIGTFDIGGGVTVSSLRGQYEQQVLIVRVDDEAAVYLLEAGKKFDVTFDDSNTLYKRVAFKHEANGDIILELESVQISEIAPPTSKPAAPIQQTLSSAEDGLEYYYSLISGGNYQKAWGLLTGSFIKKNNKTGFQPYADWWSTVDRVEVNWVNVLFDNGQSANLEANLIYYYINGQVDTNDIMQFFMIYDSSSNQWLIDDAILQ